MSHPLILALFESSSEAAQAARELRALGIPQERVSIVARSHDEEGSLADASGGSPGSEIEDSRVAARLGELSAHFLAAVALVLPGIGPIVADGPLAAGLGEAAGHAAGGIARTLNRAGLDRSRAETWESQIERGAVLIGAHVDRTSASGAAAVFAGSGASEVVELRWPA